MVWGEGVLDAFECVGWGALLIDADGCVIDLNSEAQRHVGNGIALAQGRVAATHRPANAELQRLIAAILSAGSGPSLTRRGGVLLPRPGGRPVMAYVISIAGSDGDTPTRAKAMMVLIDSDKKGDQGEVIWR